MGSDELSFLSKGKRYRVVLYVAGQGRCRVSAKALSCSVAIVYHDDKISVVVLILELFLRKVKLSQDKIYGGNNR